MTAPGKRGIGGHRLRGRARRRLRGQHGRAPRGRLGSFVTAAALAMAGALTAACGGAEPSGVVEVTVPQGASAGQIARRLERAGLIDHPRLFSLYARVTGSAGDLKSGRYRFAAGASWGDLLSVMERGEVVTVSVTIPEGFTLRQMAPRLADITGVPADSIVALATDSALVRAFGVPGPTLEGYLFPDTYRFAEGIRPRAALRTMVERYQRFWTAPRRALADSLGFTEREAVTLASIVEAEARKADERPVIAGVYLNRLRRGMLLQADPTVQYALEERQSRLLYSDIESVAESPYNTYTHTGLPPGPIAAPGRASLLAVLHPADVPYLFFVARPDGSHVFTRTQREHINAKNRIRRESRRARAASGS